MVSDAPEQIVSPLADQDASQSSEQATPALEAVGTPVPAPAADEAAPVAPAFDLSTDAGIRAAIEANPQLRGFFDKTRSDTENTVRQRLEAQMRREKGADALARQWQQQLAQKYGIELDPEDLAQGPLWISANEDSKRAEILRSLTTQAIEIATPEEQTALKALLEEADSADAVTKITAATLEALQGRIRRQALEELDPEALAEHPKFKEYIAAYKAREAEAELNAREIERTRLEAPPQTPTGQGTTAMSKTQLDAMAPAARLSYLATLSDEERSRTWDLVMSD
jgi:hypothetical protein